MRCLLHRQPEKEGNFGKCMHVSLLLLLFATVAYGPDDLAHQVYRKMNL